MRLKILAVGGTIVLALAGCAGGHAHASPTTTAPPAPTSAGINPDVIPPVITVAYVNAVFRVLNGLYGDATRSELASRTLSRVAIADLRAVYLDPQYAFEIGIFQSALKGSLNQLRPHPGDRVFTVAALQAATPSCVITRVEANYAAVDVDATPPSSGYLELQPEVTRNDPMHLNPTRWAISYEKTTSPTRPCA